MPHYYQVFGFSVESGIECPQLLSAPPSPDPDIRISYAEVPESLSDAVDRSERWQTAPGLFLLNAWPRARYMVRSGREILIQPGHQVPSETLRLVVLSAGISILLLQRRLLPVHCSAIETPLGAALFAGMSGAGKSTLAGAFLARGYRLLADDMIALDAQDNGDVLAWSGFPHIRLWADAAQALDLPTGALRRMAPNVDKFVSPQFTRMGAASCRLNVMYVLQPRDASGFSLVALPDTQRFNAILDHTWQKAVLKGMGLRQWHFHASARIASRTYIASLARPAQPFDINAAADLIEKDMFREHVLP